MLKARAQPGVLQIGLDLVDDGTGGPKRLLGLLPSLSLCPELTQGEVGLPELGRVADGLGDGQGLTEPPSASSHCRRARAISP